MNRYVFIVGCAGSGTTLLQRMLDAHPDIAVVPEPRWIPRWSERRKGVAPDGPATPELVSGLAEYHGFLEWSTSLEDLARLVPAGDPVPPPNFDAGFLDLHGEVRDERLAGDKSPAYVRSISTLHTLFPEARFVHLIRDGRDVALSVTNWNRAESAAGGFVTWIEDPVATTALWWEWNVRRGREDGEALGPELYREVHYEALVCEPARESAALCGFLGVPYDDAVLRFHEGREESDPGLDAKGAREPVTAGLRMWESEMPHCDVVRFEAAAGGLLDELGYPRAEPRPSRRTIEYLAGLRYTFTEDLRAQGNRLPERW